MSQRLIYTQHRRHKRRRPNYAGLHDLIIKTRQSICAANGVKESILQILRSSARHRNFGVHWLDKHLSRTEFQRQPRHKSPCIACRATANLHTHHIVPIASGGHNRDVNLVEVCENCHAAIHGFPVGEDYTPRRPKVIRHITKTNPKPKQVGFSVYDLSRQIRQAKESLARRKTDFAPMRGFVGTTTVIGDFRAGLLT